MPHTMRVQTRPQHGGSLTLMQLAARKRAAAQTGELCIHVDNSREKVLSLVFYTVCCGMLLLVYMRGPLLLLHSLLLCAC
jgi:hypothetical protein